MNSKVCPTCHIVILRPHHELRYWFKCSVCGYCEFDINLIHPSQQALALANKFAKLSQVSDLSYKEEDESSSEEKD